MRPESDHKTEIPASIVPVLILSGSDYQMGYQYGEQAARHFGMRLDENWVEILKEFSYEEVLRELEVSEKYIKQYAPEAIDMMKGIANGATSAGYKMSYIDVLLLNTRPRRTVPEEEELGATGCSGFAAWGSNTKDGRLVCGSSADSPMNPNVAMMVFPDKGNNYTAMSMHVGAFISHPGMNNKGLVYVHHGGGSRGPSSNSGLPGFIAVAHLLRFADTANDAKDMQLSYTTRSGGQWVDIHGNSWVGNVSTKRISRSLIGNLKSGKKDWKDFMNLSRPNPSIRPECRRE